MTTATLRIPAKSTQISMGHLGYGVDILASISLGTLADALGRMEHYDLDPGERPMNADQCRDALLRELLGRWKPSELVEAKIPGVLQMADEIATLRRERDEARESAKIGSCVWGLVEDASGDPLWSTTCKHEFVFIDGGPEENEMKFCPYCGGIIEIDTTPTPGAQA